MEEAEVAELQKIIENDPKLWDEFMSIIRSLDHLISEAGFTVEPTYDVNVSHLDYSFKRPAAMEALFDFISEDTNHSRYCMRNPSTQSLRFDCRAFHQMRSEERKSLLRLSKSA